MVNLTSFKKIRTAGYLYVIQMSDGMIKVGRTRRKDDRLSAHRTFAKNAGVLVVKHSFSQLLTDINEKEMQLISFCQKNSTACRSREWFDGVNYNEVCNFMMSFAPATEYEINNLISLKSKAEEKMANNIMGIYKENEVLNKNSDSYSLIDNIYNLIDSNRDVIESQVRLLIALNQKQEEDKDLRDDKNILLIDALRHLKCCIDFVSIAAEGMHDEKGIENAMIHIISSEDNELNKLQEKAKESFSQAIKNEDGFVFRPTDTWRTLTVEELKEMYGEDWK